MTTPSNRSQSTKNLQFQMDLYTNTIDAQISRRIEVECPPLVQGRRKVYKSWGVSFNVMDIIWPTPD